MTVLELMEKLNYTPDRTTLYIKHYGANRNEYFKEETYFDTFADYEVIDYEEETGENYLMNLLIWCEF